ncbi:MAG: TIGR01212 family radical SAM protein [Firmicutes bacterium HGW-Firmicutes-15]|nr:MAG: TIGR01212 family radical SAM protein [Firmicutes bacterium HGW-Firmicutes-15]
MNETGEEPQLWGDKRYHSLNCHLREKYGEKVSKISLDAGFSCPNRDGSLARNGCSFCSDRGSGDFVAAPQESLPEQFRQGQEIMRKKWPGQKYIAHLQAFTNTYAPVETLRKTYYIALEQPGVVGLAISTRPDCLSEEVLDLLTDINQATYLWVELGLQTIHKRSSHMLNMHYDYDDFIKALNGLQLRKIETCAHIILGLPGEEEEDMLETAQALSSLPIQGLKIHLLHLMKNTPLADIYAHQPFALLSQENYVNLVVDILEILPPQMVIHRLTGDSPKDLIIGPTWSLRKRLVLNAIDSELILRNSWQGKYYSGAGTVLLPV